MNINGKTELKGHKYKCLKTIKGLSVEDIPAIRKSITAQVEAQGKAKQWY
jgi:hypothetical protein